MVFKALSHVLVSIRETEGWVVCNINPKTIACSLGTLGIILVAFRLNYLYSENQSVMFESMDF